MGHATFLVCKETFAFRVNNKGRPITFKQGQTFWVTNTEPDQKQRNAVNVARRSQKTGYDFSTAQIALYFEVDQP